MATTGPLVLIDGHNTFIRNYVRSPYTDSNGERMGGTTGMMISVRKIVGDLNASNCLVVWDGEGGSQRRKSIYKEYKAGRTVRLNQRAEEDFGETPEQRMENMRKQRNLAQEYLTMVGIPQVRCDGVEADDIMAYVAANMDHPGGVVLVTTDQDMLQLIRESGQVHTDECDARAEAAKNAPSGLPPISVESLRDEGYPDPEKIIAAYAAKPIREDYFGVVRLCDCPRSSEVRVWSPIKKVMYDRRRFISDYGVLPENFRLVKALTGDGSDNIEGIKGFGAKTVAKCFPFLLERRASAQDVLSAAEGLSGVLGKRLTDEKSRFLENLTLVDLSAPMLSATAARQARDAIGRDLGCREVEFRMRIIRDQVSFGGNDFIGPFREFVLRRRRILPTLPQHVVIEAVIDQDATKVEDSSE